MNASRSIQKSMIACLSLFSLMFAFSTVRTPQADGQVRYRTFLDMFSGEAAEFSKYSNVQPFLAKMVDILARTIYSGLPEQAIPRYFELSLVLASSIAFLIVDKDWRRPALVGALLPLSMLSHYLGQFYAEITSSTLMALGFLLFHRSRGPTGLMIGALVGALGIANTYVLMGPLCAVVVLAAWRQWRGHDEDARLLQFLLATLAIAVTAVMVDLLVKGQLFDNPYAGPGENGFRTILPYSGRPGFSYPVLLGLISNIFSFGKSIFLFNPFLILLFVRDYKYKSYALTFLISALLLYSTWWSWYGGFSFGTRFYIFAIIPSVIVFVDGLLKPARDARFRHLEPVVLLWAIWLATCGKYFAQDGIAPICVANDYALEAFCWYVPEFSPLIHPVVSHGFLGALSHVYWLDYIYFAAALLTVSAFWAFRFDGFARHAPISQVEGGRRAQDD
ncbi:MAG: hypothetical protein Q8Q62_16710 [Mesorhizobium sp.]|nr:hypothetical protein [Mesorhizobium sp.]